MIRITDYVQRKNAEGEEFFALIVSGGIEMVKSTQTGRNYLTARKASLPCTFNEEMCKSMIGEQLPGSIKKVECEPYDYTIEKTGEVLTLTHRWEVMQDGDTVEEVIFEGKVADVEA
jgi:hypothetical protein